MGSRRMTIGFVASPGGHVDEAFEIADQFAGRGDRFWITARTMQTETLLGAEDVEWVREVKARQALQASLSLRTAHKIMRERRPRLVVSTGSALSVPYIVAARASGAQAIYVESATRLDAPSLTGRIMERVPGVERFYQSDGWTRLGWEPFGSVFDRYRSIPVDPPPLRRVLVTVGSERFPFRRALEAARQGVEGLDVVWQTGSTPASDDEFPGRLRAWWPGDELASEVRQADCVVTHAGVGSILMCLRVGLCPVLVPRMKRYSEHVDDHQFQLASVLEERGLAVIGRPGDDLAQCMREAAARRIVTVGPDSTDSPVGRRSSH